MTVELSRRRLLQGAAALGLLSQTLQIGAQPQANNLRVFVDGLSFLPDDLNDLSASKLDAYLCDISEIEAIKQPDGTTNYKRTFKACIKSISEASARVISNPNHLILGRSGTDISLANERNKTAVFFQIQGADCVEESIGNNLNQLDLFHDKGLRVLQLTHHYGNKFCGGALDNDGSQGLDIGLSHAGKDLIERLNHKNMLIDVSHSSVKGALEVAKRTSAPIVQSHGAVREIVNHARCSPDNVIKAIADTGGLFGVFMMTFWLTNERVPTTAHYINHLKHVANVGGIDAVAIANDYPLRGHEKLLALGNDNSKGVEQYVAWWHSLRARGVLGFEAEPLHVVVPELNHIERMERIDNALANSGFSSSERDKIMGKNWQRVLNQVLV